MIAVSKAVKKGGQNKQTSIRSVFSKQFFYLSGGASSRLKRSIVTNKRLVLLLGFSKCLNNSRIETATKRISKGVLDMLERYVQIALRVLIECGNKKDFVSLVRDRLTKKQIMTVWGFAECDYKQMLKNRGYIR